MWEWGDIFKHPRSTEAPERCDEAIKVLGRPTLI